MNRRLPRKVQGHLTSTIRSKAHELAHVISHAKTGSMGHSLHFMKTFMEICPEELQFFELGYKPRNAKAAGISL